MPSSLARFLNSGTVQSWYNPDLPPLRATDDLPRPAAALEIRAAFSFESPFLRRSWYSFSFLIDERGMAHPPSAMGRRWLDAPPSCGPNAHDRCGQNSYADTGSVCARR